MRSNKEIGELIIQGSKLIEEHHDFFLVSSPVASGFAGCGCALGMAVYALDRFIPSSMSYSSYIQYAAKRLDIPPQIASQIDDLHYRNGDTGRSLSALEIADRLIKGEL